MLMNEVVIGNLYRAKVSGKMTIVRITADRGRAIYGQRKHLGWEAINIKTGSHVFIRSSRRLTLPKPVEVPKTVPHLVKELTPTERDTVADFLTAQPSDLDVPVICVDVDFPLAVPNKVRGNTTYILINGDDTNTTTNLAEFTDWVMDIVMNNAYVEFASVDNTIAKRFTLTCK